MGLAHMFLFLYKHNPMCSIYTRDLPYSFFSFNTHKPSIHPFLDQVRKSNWLQVHIVQSIYCLLIHGCLSQGWKLHN